MAEDPSAPSEQAPSGEASPPSAKAVTEATAASRVPAKEDEEERRRTKTDRNEQLLSPAVEGSADKRRGYEPGDKGFWVAAEPFDRPSGRPPEGFEAAPREWRSDGALAVVVAGHVDLETQWVAEHLAQAGNPRDVRRINTLSLEKLGYLGYAGILRALSLEPERRLVLEYWAPFRAHELSRSIKELSEAVEHHVGNPCQLILWTRVGVIQDRMKDGSWPRNLALLVLEPSRVGVVPEQGEKHLDSSFFRELFGAELTSVADVFRSGERSVERTLVRIAALFGALPTSDLDDLMTAALGGETISILHGEEKEPRSVPARELWLGGKEFFLRKAGMARPSGGDRQQVGFPSQAVAEVAAAVAWADPEAMMELFVKTGSVSILFDRESEKRRKDLFDGYVNAAVTLARRTPGTFSRRWLTLIQQEYARWVRSVAPEIEDNSATLSETLSRLQQTAEVHDRLSWLWGHFAKRVGYLCRYLLADSEDIVEEFFDALLRWKLPELLWLLLREIRSRPYERYHHWIRRLLAESSQFRGPLLEMLACDAVQEPDSGFETLRQFASWMPGPGAVATNPLEFAAAHAPFPLLDELYRCHSLGRSFSFDLRPLLDRSVVVSDNADDPSLCRYLEDCLVLEGSRISRDIDGAGDETDAAYRTAVAFLQLLTVAPVDARSQVLDLAGRVKARLAPAARRAVTTELREIAEWFLVRKSRMPLNEKSRSDRELLSERTDLCRKLIHA